MFRPRYLLLNLFLIYFFSAESDAHRVLGVFPLNLRSNNNVFESVMKALAKRGHQVDVVTHFKLKNPPENYRTIINLSGTLNGVTSNLTIEQIEEVRNQNAAYHLATEPGNKLCEQILSLNMLKNLFKNPPNDPRYDLVITEACAANCFMGLAFVWKVPLIGISSTFDLPWAGEAIGNPPSTAFVPTALSRTADISTFWDRLQNSLTHYISKYQFFWNTDKPQTEMMRKYISPDTPSIREVERSLALMFINSYYSFFGVRPITPALVEIGGIQVEQNDAKLNQELQKWMDESKGGVVYFSLGSMVMIESLPNKTLLAIYSSFARLAPTRILMQIANKDKLPPGLPKNVLTLPWIPQVPVLRHNNTRLFITLGGRNSVIEALYYGVPMLGLPMSLDQFLNVAILAKKNVGLEIDYQTLSEESLYKALISLIYDRKYRISARQESQLFRDRPMNASQTAVFWVEYVLRYGANPLRSPAVDLYFWQVHLFDLFGCLIIVVCIIVVFVAFAICKIFKMVKNSLAASKKVTKKNIKKRK